MQKTPPPAQSEDEGYTAMANALRHDPRRLRSMLLARRKDLKALLATASTRKDRENMSNLSAALKDVDSALERLVLPPPTPIRADLAPIDGADEEEGEFEADDEPAAGDDEISPDDEVVEDEVADEESDEGEPEDDSDDMVEDAAEEATADDEPTEPENPVAMNSRLRKEMGDSSADFLDDYGLAIHKKVMTFFEHLMTKALDLGADDQTDDQTSLREVLREEVGKRGIRRIEPVFEEWRGVVIKTISKDVAAMFQPPEEPEEEEAPNTDLTETAQEVAEERAAGRQAPDEPVDESVAAASAAAARATSVPIVRATGPVSFTIPGRPRPLPVSASAAPAPMVARDFKPSGTTTPRLD